ncbi:MAG: hypothetical protein AVDCRST_MAG19-2741, partial [uncultured Thermomicrobiales bacterium]
AGPGQRYRRDGSLRRRLVGGRERRPDRRRAGPGPGGRGERQPAAAGGLVASAPLPPGRGARRPGRHKRLPTLRRGQRRAVDRHRSRRRRRPRRRSPGDHSGARLPGRRRPLLPAGRPLRRATLPAHRRRARRRRRGDVARSAGAGPPRRRLAGGALLRGGPRPLGDERLLGGPCPPGV